MLDAADQTTTKAHQIFDHYRPVLALPTAGKAGGAFWRQDSERKKTSPLPKIGIIRKKNNATPR